MRAREGRGFRPPPRVIFAFAAGQVHGERRGAAALPVDKGRHLQPYPGCCDRCHPRGVQGAAALSPHIHMHELDMHCSLCTIHRTLSLDVRLAVRRHAR